MAGMGREGERNGTAAGDEPRAGKTPGKETLVEQIGSGDPAMAGEGAPRAATRIDATAPGGGSSDPFDFSAFAGGTTENNPVSGAATSSSTTDVIAPIWLLHGRFRWMTGWRTNGTSGWIVQKVTSTHTGHDANGKTITPEGYGLDSEYYEAWAVDSKGSISPGEGGIHDMWQRPGFGKNSRGRWSILGEVYWTSQDPATSVMTPGGIRAAGKLLSSRTAPAGIGAVLQVRRAHGAWDSRRLALTHTGTAK